LKSELTIVDRGIAEGINRGVKVVKLSFRHIVNGRVFNITVPGISFLVLAVLFPGCKREEVTSYSVPKEVASGSSSETAEGQAPSVPKALSTNVKKLPGAGEPAGSEPAGERGPAGLPKWDVPSNWKKVAPTAMLLAKYVIESEPAHHAEVTISSFPGEAGGLAANINRWRGQLGLAPVSPTEAEKLATPIDAAGGKAMLVEMAGPDSTGKRSRLLGAIVSREGATWFYKMLGDDAAVAEQKDAFVKFVQSVQY
jgi:hypothetical protein